MTRQRFIPIAIAMIFSGLLIPITLNNGIVDYLPPWVDYHMLIFISGISIMAGLFQIDLRFYKASIFFTFPLLVWTLFSINLIGTMGDLLEFANYFSLWILCVVYMYKSMYGKDFLFTPAQWIALQIMLVSASLILGNTETGALNDFITRTGIDHRYWAIGLGSFGIALIIIPNIRLTRTVLMFALPLIFQDFYVIVYLFFVGTSKALLPLLLLKIYLIGKLAEEYYDAW